MKGKEVNAGISLLVTLHTILNHWPLKHCYLDIGHNTHLIKEMPQLIPSF